MEGFLLREFTDHCFPSGLSVVSMPFQIAVLLDHSNPNRSLRLHIKFAPEDLQLDLTLFFHIK